MNENRICELFGIQYPIIQGGMVWCSGWRLAAAVSEAGGLGLIGAGSMHPETLREHIQKCQAATDKPFGVNVPLMYPEIETIMRIIIDEGVKIKTASSDHLLVDIEERPDLNVGDVLSFRPDYTAMLSASTSEYVTKVFEGGE